MLQAWKEQGTLDPCANEKTGEEGAELTSDQLPWPGKVILRDHRLLLSPFQWLLSHREEFLPSCCPLAVGSCSLLSQILLQLSWSPSSPDPPGEHPELSGTGTPAAFPGGCSAVQGQMLLMDWDLFPTPSKAILGIRGAAASSAAGTELVHCLSISARKHKKLLVPRYLETAH